METQDFKGIAEAIIDGDARQIRINERQLKTLIEGDPNVYLIEFLKLLKGNFTHHLT